MSLSRTVFGCKFQMAGAVNCLKRLTQWKRNWITRTLVYSPLQLSTVNYVRHQRSDVPPLISLMKKRWGHWVSFPTLGSAVWVSCNGLTPLVSVRRASAMCHLAPNWTNGRTKPMGNCSPVVHRQRDNKKQVVMVVLSDHHWTTHTETFSCCLIVPPFWSYLWLD